MTAERLPEIPVLLNPFETRIILQNLASVRDQVVTAWSERGTVYSSDEQEQLRSQIKETCEFLLGLVRDQ